MAFNTYRDFYRAYIDFGTEVSRVFDRADFDTKVGLHATGQQYNELLHYFSNQRPRGVFFRGPPVEHDPDPEITVDGDKATIRDCMFDAGETYDADDNTVIDSADDKRELKVVRLERVAGVWKVADVELEGECAI
ncbi:MAG TPA: hypothetical protein VM938_07150 [Acidimicrobiales bacterium]|nr:hypothetical protein [Acidimicrobiales bacterium]